MSRANSSGTKAGRYRDAFVEHLAGVLRGELPNERLRLFIEWLERSPFICEGCQEEEFDVSASEVTEDDLILCEKCRKDRH